MITIDLTGPKGNAFALIATMMKYDSNIDPGAFGSYEEVLKKFVEVAGKDYRLVNVPNGINLEQ